MVGYVVDPFLPSFNDDLLRHHANYWRAQIVVRRLLSLGFDVDVTDWRNVHTPKAKYYDIVIGQARSFRASCSGCKKNIPRVFLGAGPYAKHAISKLRERVNYLKSRSGISIEEVHPGWWDGVPWATDIFYVGNSYVRDTYAKATSAHLFGIPNTVTQGVLPTWAAKDYSSARHVYLWLAAYGPMRRGLDILLEVFEHRKDCELWVCGDIRSSSPSFFRHYQDLLENQPNIHSVGWVDVASDAFSSLTRRCGYLLYPSASDGMPGSVVNSMAAGVVPIVTPEAGIDVSPWGLMIDELTHQSISEILDQSSSIPQDELKARSEAVSRLALLSYSRNAFEKAFSSHLDAVLSRYESLLLLLD